MKPIDGDSQLIFNLQDKATKSGQKSIASVKSDSIEISNTAKVYDNVDKFLNLGSTDRVELSKMNSAEKDEFLKMLGTVIKRGVVGYEVLKVNGRPEKHFIENEIGDKRIYGAKLYKKNEIKND